MSDFLKFLEILEKFKVDWISVDPLYIIGDVGSARGFQNHMKYVKGVTHLSPTVSQLAVHYLHQINITWSYGSCDKS